MKRWLVIILACGCAPEPPATNTIAPADPRPAPTSTAAVAKRPPVTTSGSPPPASALAPGTVLVTIDAGRIDMRELLPRGQAAFHLTNRTGIAHEIAVRGGEGTTAAQLPPHSTAVLQLLLGPGRYEVSCTVPGHSERAVFETYVAGAPLNVGR